MDSYQSATVKSCRNQNCPFYLGPMLELQTITLVPTMVMAFSLATAIITSAAAFHSHFHQGHFTLVVIGLYNHQLLLVGTVAID